VVNDDGTHRRELVTRDRHHQTERVLADELRRLEYEEELTRLAQERHRDLMRERILRDPASVAEPEAPAPRPTRRRSATSEPAPTVSESAVSDAPVRRGFWSRLSGLLRRGPRA
jgi:hypothetical protein